ncbi:NADH-quinone oxidoreductase subunit NuoK [Buchnera aphidicola (Taiwanaphis decaspermi)]|uniref:NADH-quinone oxidoreductase subunit NuoK n=1 Tax=Buchnera aphidicola TaxID=9 RepID=UPI0031B86492
MIPLSHGLIVSSILFFLGLTSLVLHKNLIFIIISLEIMINAVITSFIISGSYWFSIDGQIFYILIITFASVETTILLSLLIKNYRFNQTLNIDKLSETN